MTDPRRLRQARPPAVEPVETRRVRIIGIGSGHLDQLTGEATDAISGLDYVLAVAKGADDPLLAVRQALCERLGVPLVVVADPERDRENPPDYPGAVADWHAARVRAFEEVLTERSGDVGFLVWGDPAFYDSTIRVVEELAARLPIRYDVLPGISSPQLLAARHRVVLHAVGRPVLISTGRRLLEDVAAGHDNIVVMLDGGLRCLDLDRADWRIWWGANLGTDDEVLLAGRLDEVAAELVDVRAAVKAGTGWVLDTYLLRRP